MTGHRVNSLDQNKDSPAAASPYQRLQALGINLPHVREGNILYLSGQGPREVDGHLHAGKVGADVDIDSAYDHARLTGINLLAVMHDALGDLGRVKRIVKILGMVNAVPDFAEHPRVINGCSDLMMDVFGEAGSHARSAVGFGSLPGNITVEIEAIVALHD
jgi:enamine deaminase RidA (YjgF/YER057c/UK114 family)